MRHEACLRWHAVDSFHREALQAMKQCLSNNGIRFKRNEKCIGQAIACNLEWINAVHAYEQPRQLDAAQMKIWELKASFTGHIK